MSAVTQLFDDDRNSLHDRFMRGEEMTPQQVARVRSETNIMNYRFLLEMRLAALARERCSPEYRAALRARGDYERAHKFFPK